MELQRLPSCLIVTQDWQLRKSLAIGQICRFKRRPLACIMLILSSKCSVHDNETRPLPVSLMGDYNCKGGARPVDTMQCFGLIWSFPGDNWLTAVSVAACHKGGQVMGSRQILNYNTNTTTWYNILYHHSQNRPFIFTFVSLVGSNIKKEKEELN